MEHINASKFCKGLKRSHTNLFAFFACFSHKACLSHTLLERRIVEQLNMVEPSSDIILND